MKIFLIVAVALLCIVAGGITTLYILLPPQKIVALTLPQAENALGRKITVEGANFRFLPLPGLSLSGLRIGNTAREGFSKGTVSFHREIYGGHFALLAFQGFPGSHRDYLL